MRHPPMANYDSLDTAALQFRLAFRKGATPPDPAMPDDVPGPDYFPELVRLPAVPRRARRRRLRATARQLFDVDTEPLPEHLCDLLLKTMQDVYTGTDDMAGPAGPALGRRQAHRRRWPADRRGPPGHVPGRLRLREVHLELRPGAAHADAAAADHGPRPARGRRASRRTGMAPDLANSRPMTLLDILLAILAFAIYIAELAAWLATIAPALLADLATWPLRELIFQLLVVPAWDLYMLCRHAARPRGLPRPQAVRGVDGPRQARPGRAGIDRPAPRRPGRAIRLRHPARRAMLLTERSGLDPTTRGAAHRRASASTPPTRAPMVTDLDPPWLDTAPADAAPVYSEFVAPWRYPEHNMAGMRTGWEAPRTHVGPLRPGRRRRRPHERACRAATRARQRFEAATTPEETEAASAELLPTAGANLGDPIDYGAYLMGQLTGRLTTDPAARRRTRPTTRPPRCPTSTSTRTAGYAYQCWDYERHAPSVPPAGRTRSTWTGRTSGSARRRSWAFLSQIGGVHGGRPGDAGPRLVRLPGAADRPAAVRRRRQPAPPVAATTRSSASRTTTCR